jgi:hypothetical protein
LTFGSYVHLGNDDPGPGSDLIGDLMNGVTFYTGTRYDISALDAAVLRDVGLSGADTLPAPEPSTFALVLTVGLGWAIVRRRG